MVTSQKIFFGLTSRTNGIECFHLTSRQPYYCSKTMKQQPCWCSKPILWELNSFVMQKLSLGPTNLHRCQPRERKCSIIMQLFETSQLQLRSKGGSLMRACTRTFCQNEAGPYWVILKMYAWEEKLECGSHSKVGWGSGGMSPAPSPSQKKKINLRSQKFHFLGFLQVIFNN